MTASAFRSKKADADVAILIDVLHHTQDPEPLLREAIRVTRDAVIVKDHYREGILANATLRFMDDVGNKRHGVERTYNYLRSEEWTDLFARVGLAVDHEEHRLQLYPWYASWIFDRSLHFIARLRTSSFDRPSE